MAYCEKCGTQVDDNVNFCPGCGAPIGKPDAQQATPGGEAQKDTQNGQEQNDFGATLRGLNNTTDTTQEFDSSDIQQNKGMAILSYFGILLLIPMLVNKTSKFTQFHVNQGLVLFIAAVGYGIIQAIITAILCAIFPWNWSLGILGSRGPIFGILSTLLSLLWIVFIVLAVIGIINAANGRAKELPVIGKFKILK